MKNIKKKFVIILILFIAILFFQFITIFNNVKAVDETEDVYDVILFWGQSNMQGCCGARSNEKQADTRYNRLDSNSVKEYSKKTGIDEEFLSNAEQMNYVKIAQTPKTVYEYMYLTNSLVELNEQTKYNGESLVLIDNKLQKADGSSPNSIDKSLGTTLIPEFCKTYYEKTGHKVIAVSAAKGGASIGYFTTNQDGYKAITEKYKSAIEYLNNNNYKIGNKLWVSFQGESNLGSSVASYENSMLEVHKNLKKDLNITKGVVIETSSIVGNQKKDGVENVHKAKVNFALNNDDIVLGSSYSYDRYVPSKEQYESDDFYRSVFTDSNGKKLPYETAFDIATMGVCYPDNTHHFTSSALCQIGKETAINLARLMDETSPKVDVSYSEKEETRNFITATIKANEEIEPVEGWTLSEDKMTLTKEYRENISEDIIIYDLAGNSRKVNVKIDNIDDSLYDVILFWGQSNMQGSANKGKPERYINVDSETLSDYSAKSGIDIEFLENAKAINNVKVNQVAKTVYEYMYESNSLEELTNEKVFSGENLKLIDDKLQNANGYAYKLITIDKSSGTTLIPEFCKTYYEKTGHKVIAVSAAKGGASINYFMPNQDGYKAVTEKYKSAIEYLNNNNYKIGNKLWVSFQGESDVGWTVDGLENTLLKVHNNLKKDLDITNGAVIETSTTIGNNGKNGVENVHKAKVNFAINNDDIVLGSSYSYERYIPCKEQYESDDFYRSVFTDSNGKKLPYETAFDIATMGVCYSDNTIHFNSSALCQIGKETAINLAKLVNGEVPKLSVSYSNTSPTNQDVTVTITSDEELQEVKDWILSEDKKSLTKVYSKNKKEEIIVCNAIGIRATVEVEVSNIDKESPKSNVKYSTTKATNQDVTVTITANEELQEVKGWTLSEDKKSLTKVYSKNGKKEEITIYDLVGNSSKATVEVSNIDKEKPDADVKYSTTEATNKDITVTITANEELQEVEGWKLSKDKKTLTKVYSENGKEEITIYDLAGNSVKANVEVSNIDKKELIVSVKYSTTKSTNQDVTVTITSDKELQEVKGWTLSEDKKSLTKVYSENRKKEEITIYDLAGNSAKANVEVSNIDKENPKPDVKYSTKEKTNQDVTVTITANEELQEVEGWKLSKDRKTLTKVYSENGKEEITIYDLAGNSEKVNVEVSNIDKNTAENVSENEDKVSPIGKVSYSTTQTTDQYVTVTITANEELREVVGWILSKDKKSLTKMYIENKKETVVIYDLAGNKTEIQVDVNNIQRDIPTVYPKTGSSTIVYVGMMIFSIMLIVIYKKSK